MNRGDVVQRAAGEVPSFSVVIPTWNRPRQLERCLAALAVLDYPREQFEVVVVDDGSRPPIADRVRPVVPGVRIKWLRQDNAGPAAARNLGVQHAEGEYLAFIDDDCTPMPEWLGQLAAVFARSPEALVGGRTGNALEGNPYSTASQLIIETAYCWLPWAGSELQFFASNNFAMRADLFRATGGFDASFRTSEDRDLCDRWVRAGRSLLYAPHAVVQHWHQLTLAGYCRQHFGYGRGAYRFHRARERRGASPFRPELPFYREVFRVALETPAAGRRLALAGLLVVWQVANAAGYVWQKGRDGTTPDR
jgi:glycosyltransferase involved in cell wall biosynthesis